MSDDFRILAQVFPTDTNETDLYRVPVPQGSGTVGDSGSASLSATQTLVTSLTVCSHGAPSSFRVRLKQERTGFVIPDHDKQWLFYDTPIAANDEKTMALGLALPGDASLTVRSGDASRLSFNLVGIEVT